MLELLVEGDFVEEEATGRVELDEEDQSLWAEYTSDRWEVRVDFEELDAEVLPLEDPQVWTVDNDGFGWAVAHAPICGTVRLPDRAGVEGEEKVWDVQASGWDVDCDYAMDVAELQEDPISGGRDRREFLHGSRGTHSGIWQIDAMSCGIFWHEVIDDDGFLVPSYAYGPCQEATVLTPSDEEDLYRESEVGFGPLALIDFHEQS